MEQGDVSGEQTGRADGRRRTGILGEDYAARLLTSRGATVIDRNWRCREGELDLVAIDSRDCLRFVEVRARSGRGFGTPAESVTREKQRRLRRLARLWLLEHPAGWRRVAFDVVGVDLSDPERPLLDLFEDVF